MARLSVRLCLKSEHKRMAVEIRLWYTSPTYSISEAQLRPWRVGRSLHCGDMITGQAQPSRSIRAPVTRCSTSPRPLASYCHAAASHVVPGLVRPAARVEVHNPEDLEQIDLVKVVYSNAPQLLHHDPPSALQDLTYTHTGTTFARLLSVLRSAEVHFELESGRSRVVRSFGFPEAKST